MESTTILDPTQTRPQPALALRTEGLGKSYRTGFWMNKRVESLKNCTLSVNRGESFGLLGPNGAGKTTLMKILLGFVPPTSGTAQILGQPLGNQDIKNQLGYLPENPYFYDYLTGTEVLRFTARLFNLDQRMVPARIAELLTQVGLSEAAGAKQLRKYSKGMLQRIGLAQALINDPELVFLDEPMSGLDPMGRFQMRELILSLKQQGKTVFFNSHILSDVEQICDRVGILAQGEVVALGSLDELLGVAETYHVYFQSPTVDSFQEFVADLEPQGLGWQGVLRVEPMVFLAALAQTGGLLLDLKLQRPSLEAFFVERVANRTTSL